MGVPSFFRWLVEKYPDVAVHAKTPKEGEGETCSASDGGMVFDNLYLDMNGIIHPCFHPEDQEAPTTFDEVFQSIFEYIDWLFKIVRPRKLLFMAIDGVAPRAKMNQQRSRRFRTAKDAEIAEAEEDRLRKEFERKGQKVLPKQESEVSDSNIITPGTCFMDKLAKALQGYICTRLNHDPEWKNIKVILSDANAPGEGEHKIMNFIRLQRGLSGYDANTRHCLYGLDADLIMLALATHEPHFAILREDVLMEEKRPGVVHPVEASASALSMLSEGDTSKWRPRFLSKKLYQKPYQFLNIWTLREYLEIELQIPDPPFEIDFERILDDFIFICFFTGNDFLPHMPTLEIRENAIDLLMSVYKDEFKSRGGYLVNTEKLEDRKAGYVKLKRIEKFILSVGTYEEMIFRKRDDLKQRMIKKLYRQMSEQEIMDEQFIESSFRDMKLHEDSLDMSGTIDQNDILANTKELKKQVKNLMREKQDLFKQGSLEREKVQLGMKGWKERYYKEKFSVEGSTEVENKRKEIVQKYVEGLCWVLQYYFSGVRSWSWFYPHHHGPFASDLKGLGTVKISFTRGLPFKPFDQLMGVLPPRSIMALPKVYWPLMTSEKSKLIDFYPTDFEVDVEGKRHMWQGIIKLPFIDERMLRCETQKLENELEENEVQRNSQSREKIFVFSSHGLGSQIRSLYKDIESIKSGTEVRIPVDAYTSGGMNGFLSPCIVDLEWSDQALENKVKEHVIYASYEYPDTHPHIPRLLENIVLPEKTVVETDIVKKPLWHEYEGHRPPSNRFQIQDKYWKASDGGNPMSPDPVSTRESHNKGAGFGGSVGRGKGTMAATHCTNHGRGRGFSPRNIRPESPRSSLETGQRNLGRGRVSMEASWNGAIQTQGQIQSSYGNCSTSRTGYVESAWDRTSVSLRPTGGASGTNVVSERWVPGRGRGYESPKNQHMPTIYYSADTNDPNYSRPIGVPSEKWVSGRGQAHVESPRSQPTNYYSANTSNAWRSSPEPVGRVWRRMGSESGCQGGNVSSCQPTNYYSANTSNAWRSSPAPVGREWIGMRSETGSQGGNVNSGQHTNYYSTNTSNAWTSSPTQVGHVWTGRGPETGIQGVNVSSGQHTNYYRANTLNACSSSPTPVGRIWTGRGPETGNQGGNVSSGQWYGPPGGKGVARGNVRPSRNDPKNDSSFRR